MTNGRPTTLLSPRVDRLTKLATLNTEMLKEFAAKKTVRGGNTMYDCPMCGVTAAGPECRNRDCWLVKIGEVLDG